MTEVAQPQVLAQAAFAPQPTGPVASSSLYVGDLLPEITEAVLFDIFNAIGPVASVRVCRDAITRRSLGYAYVNFQNPADAERAIETMNFEPIQGKNCRIMWCQRDPAVRRSGVGNIFVKGLDKSIDNKALHEAFSTFGNILSVKVVVDAHGQSVGRGFVHFEKEEDAKEAIAQANGTLLKNIKISVDTFKSRKERMEEHGAREQQFTNVFVKNLGEASENDLTNAFAPFGKITSLYLGVDQSVDPPKKRGYGFVNFSTPEEAKKAVEEMNGKEIGGLAVFVGRAMKKAERQAVLRRDYERKRLERQQNSRGVNLYVKNLDEDVDDAKFRGFFEPFGNITSHKIMRDEKGNSRGFGFVCFDSQDEATRAITELNNRIIGSKPLYVALSQPKEERRNQLSIQYRRMQFQRPGAYMQQQPGMYPGMMFMNPMFGGPRPQQPFFNQGGARMGAPRFAAPQQYGQFAPQQVGGPRGPRPNYPRQQQQFGPQGAYPRGGQGRFSNQARNTGMQGSGPADMQPAVPQQQLSSQQLTSQLASAEPSTQKQILGDNLYPLVAARYPAVAGKLTGMLLQMDNSEILHLLEDQVTLQQELEKAHEVLRQHLPSA